MRFSVEVFYQCTSGASIQTLTNRQNIIGRATSEFHTDKKILSPVLVRGIYSGSLKILNDTKLIKITLLNNLPDHLFPYLYV